METNKCAFCKKLYNPTENYGRLECSYHTGYISYQPHRDRFDHHYYTCCDKIMGSEGCTKCDHDVQNSIGNNREVKLKLKGFDLAGGTVKMPPQENIIDWSVRYKTVKGIQERCGDTSYIRVRRAH
jgi:hypothetical protein